jgi:hypothetical protein
MKNAFIAFAFFFVFHAHAQDSGYLPGAIITLQNERIEGLVKNVNTVPARILDNIKFKRGEDAKVEQYSPEELLAYESDGHLFVPKKTPLGNKIFVRKFNTGKLHLYGKLAFDGTASYNVAYIPYVQLENDPVIHEVQQLSFKKQMLSYLKDAPGVCKLIEDKTLKKKDIEQIVRMYNEEVQRAK